MSFRILAMVAVLCLGGCGGGEAPPASTPPSGAQIAAASQPEPAPTAAPSAATTAPAGAPAGEPAEVAAVPAGAPTTTPTVASAVTPAVAPAATPAVASAAAAPAPGAAPRFRPDVDYRLIRPAQPTSSPTGRVEVAEIFQYGCGGCARFEPYLESWAATKPEYVDLVFIPAVWNQLGELHARAFYTAEALGILEQTHAPFFKAFHVEGNHLETEAKLREFFGGFGVEAERFDATFKSFAVHTKVQRAKELGTRYGVPETPSIVVNGKYLTLGTRAETYRRWFEIVDELAAAERGAN